MSRYPLMVACAAFVFFASTALAADEAKNLSHLDFSSKEFPAPEGFGGYAWKTPLGKVSRLESEPVYVRVANFRGKVIHFDPFCYQRLMVGDGSTFGGGDHVAAMNTCRETDGDGFHALAEYYVDSQGYRVSDESGGKVVMFPVTYQFCAHWKGFSNDFKGDPLESMLLCGARLHFRSETTTQEQAIVDHTYRTGYERALAWLIKNYGRPEDFDPNGRVLLPKWETDSPPQRVASKDRYRSEYWCQPRGEALVPRCTASIVLTFDTETGLGQVIFLTGPVWAYAYARQFGGAEGDPLYRVLHGGMGQPRVDHHQCVDSFICRPPPPGKMPQEMLARFTLAKKEDAK